MFLSMNNSYYMSNRNRYKDIGTCLSQIPLMHSHVTRNALDDPNLNILSKVNSNCMPIWYHIQDIRPFNNLLIKLINLITMV